MRAPFLMVAAVSVIGAGAAGYVGVGANAGSPTQAHRSDTVAAGVIALGDSIYHGRAAGGMCMTCHSARGAGVPGLAPDLTDARWLHGDGSVPFIAKVITAGIPRPKESSIPMQPYGGGRKLTSAQVDALARYVRTLSTTGAGS